MNVHRRLIIRGGTSPTQAGGFPPPFGAPQAGGFPPPYGAPSPYGAPPPSPQPTSAPPAPTPEADSDSDAEYGVFDEDTPLGTRFDEKDEAKALGARWNGEHWFAPAGTERTPELARWVVPNGATRRYLRVPFEQKDDAKREVGARWMGAPRAWYLPPNHNCPYYVDRCRSRGWL